MSTVGNESTVGCGWFWEPLAPVIQCHQSVLALSGLVPGAPACLLSSGNSNGTWEGTVASSPQDPFS